MNRGKELEAVRSLETFDQPIQLVQLRLGPRALRRENRRYQVAEFSFGSGSTTFTCGTEPVDWHITVYGSPGWHSGWVNVNAIFSDGVGITSDSRGFAI